MTSKFKVGDMVMLDKNSKWNNGRMCNPVETLGEVIEVFGVDPALPVRVRWSNTRTNRYREEDLIFADTTAQIREEIKKAVELLEKHKIGVYRFSPTPYIVDTDYHKTLDSLLDKLYPLETPQQKKLKELEEKQLKIAEEMMKLRMEM